MPLTLARVGEKNRIVRISGRDQTRRHLANLGLVEGQAVTVVSKLSGNMIVQVKDSRLALDREMTGRIWIEREE
ncbi:MAG: ferrous iron transport protein A [Clostridiales bacterium]|nr:ferrous iron transport protein A [Clostridiales bacterium]